MGDLGIWKIVIIAVVVLVIFGGATRLPIFAKGLGQSVRVFRKEMHDVKTDIAADRAQDGEEPLLAATERVADSRPSTPGASGS